MKYISVKGTNCPKLSGINSSMKGRKDYFLSVKLLHREIAPHLEIYKLPHFERHELPHIGVFR